MSSRPPLTWVGAVVGFAAQAVVLAVVTVVLAHDAVTTDGDDATNVTDAVFRGLFNGLFYAIAAVITGLLTLMLLLVLLLSIRRGGARLAGLIVGLVFQVPLVWFSIGALEDGAGLGEVVTLVGGALVLLGVVVPATWRWCRRPRALPAPPSPYAGGPWPG